MSKTIIVSNRLPVKISEDNGTFTFFPSEGGLATGLGSIYQSGENMWIGWPGLEVTDAAMQEDVTSQLKDMSLFPVFLSQEEITEYYEGFSNDILWPVFHYYASTYANYQQSNWEFYQAVNQKFCDAVLAVADEGDTIWVHDYQLLLLPGMIRARRPGLTIGFFQHIPFPSYEMFRLIPWRAQLLEGICGADLVGFHTFDDVQHFLAAATRILPYNSSSNVLMVGDRAVVAEAFPMGIDYEKYSGLPAEQEVIEQARQFREQFKDYKLMLSIDRLDYSKGILQRLHAFEELLARYPEYIEKVVLYMIVVPSRDNVPSYKELRDAIDKKVGNINAIYRTMEWSPVLYFYRPFPIETLSTLYHVADIAMVTPMRDGMNLVCKEYVASRTQEDGVLVLSEMAGASKELIDALIVNPNSMDDMVQTMITALNMPESEQQQRMKELRKTVAQFNISHWVKIYRDKLREVKEMQASMLSRHVDAGIGSRITRQYCESKRRIIFLDYDGTLVNFSTNINMASPDEHLYTLLKELTRDTANTIVLISGRDHQKLQEWFGGLGVHMIAEHGVWQCALDGNWDCLRGLSDQWKEDIRPLLQTYTERTPGAFIEEKSFSLVWHYRKVAKGLGELRASELMNNLNFLIKDRGLQLLPGNKVIEVKNIDINKGKAALEHLYRSEYDFVMAVGDDHTDEDLFKALPDTAVTLKVGSSVSAARFYLRNPDEVRRFLSKLSCQ